MQFKSFNVGIFIYTICEYVILSAVKRERERTSSSHSLFQFNALREVSIILYLQVCFLVDNFEELYVLLRVVHFFEAFEHIVSINFAKCFFSDRGLGYTLGVFFV